MEDWFPLNCFSFIGLTKSITAHPPPQTTSQRTTISRGEKLAAYRQLSGPHHYVHNRADEEAFKYLCGAVLSDFFRLNGNCDVCRENTCSAIPQNSFIEMRKFDVSSNLHNPNEECLRFFTAVDSVLHRHLPANIHRLNVKSILMEHARNELLMPVTSCEAHEPYLRDFLSARWIHKSIKIHCKDAIQHLIKKRRECRKRRKLTKSAIPPKRRTLI